MEKIIISAQSLESFRQNKKVVGISQEDATPSYTAAPIDEKNIGSDWFGDVFDDQFCVKSYKDHRNKLAGYISGVLVESSWRFGDNVLIWHIFATGVELSGVMAELKKRLQMVDQEKPVTDLVTQYEEENKCTLHQSFFWNV